MLRLILATVTLSITACKVEKTVTTSSDDPAPKAVEPAPVPAPAPAPAPAPSGPATELSFEDAVTRGEELMGKPVIVTAISWGTQGMTTGGQRLNLGPRPLEGAGMAAVVADFAKADLAQLDRAPKDAKVRLHCTMGEFAYNARKLEGCKVLP
jgi:hypothetical protein